MYIKKVQPYATTVMNMIEYFTNAMVLTMQYYLLSFGQEILEDELKSMLGLGFSIMLIILFMSSLISLVITKIVSAIPKLKSAYFKIKKFLSSFKRGN